MTTQLEVITPELQQQIHRRTLTVVVISQSFGGAGLAAGISVGALIAQDMLGSEALSGLPSALFTLGAALTAFLLGRVTQVAGRRKALGFGFTAGGIGAIGVVLATTLGSIPLLFFALFVYGAGTATNLQTRYAGTDLAAPDRKGTAISMAMVSTTIGAVAGPNLIEPMGRLATSLGVPALAGPFLLAAVAYLLAGIVLLIMLRPDPFLLSQQILAQNSESTEKSAASGAEANNKRTVLVGAMTLVISQIVMVGIMTMTPIHMRAHDQSLGAVGLVIGLHVGSMWLPSLVTGRLVDRVGPRITATAGGLILLVSGLTAAFAPADGLTGMIVALMLLGLGWNLGLVSGTTLIVHGTKAETRAKTQGSIDVWYQIFGAGSGILSGLIMSAAGYGVLAIVGGMLALVIIPALTLTRTNSNTASLAK